MQRRSSGLFAFLQIVTPLSFFFSCRILSPRCGRTLLWAKWTDSAETAAVWISGCLLSTCPTDETTWIINVFVHLKEKKKLLHKACVHVCVGLLWKVPRSEDEMGGARKKKNTRKLQHFTRSGWTRGPRRSDSAVWAPGFPAYDCAFLWRERSLYRKLNHVSRKQGARAQDLGEKKKYTESLQLTRLQELDLRGMKVWALSSEN